MQNDTLTFLIIGGAIVLLFILGWRFKRSVISHGAARWLPLWEASGEGLFRSRGLLLGDWAGLLPVYGGQEGHALTIAPTGRGKGTCAIIPNLLRQRFAFVVDPGGENTAVAIKAWRARGFDIQVLNPWGMHAAKPWELPCHRFNPLAILDPKNPCFASDASLIAEMLITRGRNDGGSSAYFKDEAQSGMRALIMHLATAAKPGKCHLGTLRACIMLDHDRWDRLIEAMIRNEAAGGLIKREAAQLLRRKEQAPEEFSAIVSTMKQDTNFLDDPVMRDALSGSDASFSALKGMKDGKRLPGAFVSVVIPLEYLRTHAAYARLAIAVALWKMQRAPIARERVLFVLDEFPALGRLERIAKGLAELRKYKVWLWPIIQDLSQLRELYQTSWPTFLSNASVKQWFGTADLETAKYLSEACGDATAFAKPKAPNGQPVFQQPLKRRLLTVEEIICMPPHRQVVTAGHLRPIRLRLRPYWERPQLARRFNKNPYAGHAPPLSLATLPRAVWGKLVWGAAAILEPAPKLIFAAVIAGLLWEQPGVFHSEKRDQSMNRTYCMYRVIFGFQTWQFNSRRFECRKIKLGRRFFL